MQEENIIRYNPSKEEGLSQDQVNKRKKQNLVNFDTSVPTKSIRKIITDNLFTIFNLLNLFLAIAIISVHSYKNVLFLCIIFCNTIISIVQEINSKRKVDKLAIISAVEVNSIRDGKKQKIKINDIVLDDVLEFNIGNQIITDSVILDGEVEVNESCITGEEDSIYKKKGDMLLSGSYVVSGKCTAKVEHVGKDNYASSISNDAKKIKKVKSEIMTSLNKIIKIATFVVIPLGILLFLKELNIADSAFDKAVVNTVAAVIGMIPEGLVLLVSTVLTVSVIRLAKKNVLVQSLYCIETLARVDTLCLDKTGTITENKMVVSDVISVDNSKEEIKEALNILSNFSEDENSTIEAIREKYKGNIDNYKIISNVPFNSKRKWSGLTIENKGTYIIGSPEFVLKKDSTKYNEIINKYIKENRVIVLVHSDEKLSNMELPDNLKVMGFILIKNKIRKQAKEMVEYFKKQGVNIKVISGDNPVTVSEIAKMVNIEGYDKYIDASILKTKEDIQNAVNKYTVFGRVTPSQKQEIIKALKNNGHTVAMTGDGVNDVLALKESDCAITVASGSDAARNISQLVLLNSNFDAVPSIVAEGRRTINNIERSATLFLTKTIYSTLMGILFLFITYPYPFVPIQLTFISVLTIGIPSFVLALEPNEELVRGRFLPNVFKKSLPTALIVILNIISVIICTKIFDLDDLQYSTLCVMMTGITGLILLLKISLPFNKIRAVLFGAMCTLFFVIAFNFSSFLSLSSITLPMLVYIVCFSILSLLIYDVVAIFTRRAYTKTRRNIKMLKSSIK